MKNHRQHVRLLSQIQYFHVLIVWKACIVCITVCVGCVWTVYLCGVYRCGVWPGSLVISKIRLNISYILAVAVFGDGVVSGILDTWWLDRNLTHASVQFIPFLKVDMKKSLKCVCVGSCLCPGLYRLLRTFSDEINIANISPHFTSFTSMCSTLMSPHTYCP